MADFEDEETFVLHDWKMMHPVERVRRTHHILIPAAVRGLLDALPFETRRLLLRDGSIEQIEDQSQRLSNGELDFAEVRYALLDQFEPFAICWVHQAFRWLLGIASDSPDQLRSMEYPEDIYPAALRGYHRAMLRLAADDPESDPEDDPDDDAPRSA